LLPKGQEPVIKPKEKASVKPAKDETAKADKATPLKPVPEESKHEKEKSSASEEKADVDAAVKRLAEKIKSEEEGEAVIRKSIEELKAYASIQKKIEELKRDIERRGSIAKKIVEIKPVVKNTETASIVTGKITQELIDMEFKAYYSMLWETIQANWAYPDNSRKDLTAVIGIKISRAGNLIEKWFEKYSGSSAFDQSAMRAIEKAAPFPPLPDIFKDNFMEIGLCFPECKKGE